MANESRATYVLVPGLDAAILKTLPNEGAKVGNLVPLGKQMKRVARELSHAGVTAAQVNGRIKVLEHHGFVVKVIVMPVSGGPGWQITPLGKSYVEKEGDA